MCDTVIAPGSVTADGVTLFGKNSDRAINEAHHLLRVPRQQHPPGAVLECTYITIPQVAQTWETLLARPFWIWGAEMGANEHGVTIGNEAVFSKIPHEKEPGLIGMDLLRLALERARTARQALDVITALLEQYGQGGNCGYGQKLLYDNSFIIADPHEAWVLETAGRHWAAEQVEGIRTISNGHSITTQYTLVSEHAIDYALERGWAKTREGFSFAAAYADFVNTTFSRSHRRMCRTRDSLALKRGEVAPEHLMAVLRDHGGSRTYDPLTASILDFSVCAHGGFGPVRSHGQTTGSMVSRLGVETQTHWLTGTSAPCTSIFKPVWLGADLPDTGPQPGGVYDPAALWWQHERLHRATLQNYPERIALYRDARDELELEFITGAIEHEHTAPEARAGYASQCWQQASRAEAGWLDLVLNHQGRQSRSWINARTWHAADREAQMPAGAG